MPACVAWSEHTGDKIMSVTFSTLLLSKYCNQSERPISELFWHYSPTNENDSNLLICLDAARLYPIVIKSIRILHLGDCCSCT